MVSVEVLRQVVIYSMVWSTFSTVIIMLARRDVALGLKKWWFVKSRKSPIKLRFHGADKSVTEYILATKGKGEVLELGGKKMFFVKSPDGSTFLLDEKAIRRTDDGLNEISYNYKSIMPLYPAKSEVEVAKARADVIARIEAQKKQQAKSEVFVGVNVEDSAQYTDPKRLNRLIEYIKLAAKTEALSKATDVEKYVKYTMYAAGVAAIMGVLVWYTMDNQIIPQLAGLAEQVRNLGSTVLNL